MLAWDRVKGSLLALVGAADPRARYAGCFGATVKSVSDMAADVELDDAGLPGMAALSLQVGIPAATVDFSPGAHVRVAFENRDPAKPFIVGWAPGATALRVSMPATKVELGAEHLNPVQDGVLTGQSIDPFTSMPHFALGNASPFVLAKKM